MTREEAKQMLPIIQAYAEGKEIQFKLEDKWINTKNPDLEFGVGTYRIKPEPKYRPFKNAKECWEEMQKHQPFGWIRFYGRDLVVCAIGSLYENEVEPYDRGPRKFTTAFEDFSFIDDTPFGIKEEE